MAWVIQKFNHAEDSVRAFGPIGWAFAAAVSVVIAAYAFAALRIFGLLG